jgi:hypothetical protein
MISKNTLDETVLQDFGQEGCFQTEEEVNVAAAAFDDLRRQEEQWAAKVFPRETIHWQEAEYFLAGDPGKLKDGDIPGQVVHADVQKDTFTFLTFLSPGGSRATEWVPERPSVRDAKLKLFGRTRIENEYVENCPQLMWDRVTLDQKRKPMCRSLKSCGQMLCWGWQCFHGAPPMEKNVQRWVHVRSFSFKGNVKPYGGQSQFHRVSYLFLYLFLFLFWFLFLFFSNT